MNAYLEQLSKSLVDNLPKFLTALVILIVGLVVTKIVVRLTASALKRSRLDLSLHAFLRSSVKIILLFVVLVITAGALGINTGSLLAILGAVGLAVSLAVKDSLANLASGLLILITHPFRVHDFIEAEGASGIVMEIGLIYTRLNTPDNKQVFLPNSKVTSAQITNYSAEDTRRLDLVFSISYNDSIDSAKDAIAKIVDENPLTLNDPAPIIRVCAHSESSIDIATRVWVKTDDYWDLNFDLHEQVKKEFDRLKISIPYRHLDVNIHNQ